MSQTYTNIGYKHKSQHAIKISVRIHASNIQFALDVTAVHHQDCKYLEAVLENAHIKVGKFSSAQLLADKGYYGKPCQDTPQTTVVS